MAALRIVSVDVECVATGVGHNDRSIATIAVVDSREQTLLNVRVTPHLPVVSMLTPITGLERGALAGGLAEEAALQQVYALLGPDVLLVGQNPQSDATWLRLVPGVHYAALFDLAQLFKQINPRYNSMSFYPMHHVARTLLNVGSGGAHSADEDARISVRLYNLYAGDSGANRARLVEGKKRLLSAPNSNTNIAKSLGYQHEGVCLAAFLPERCSCGQPTKRGT